MLRRTAVHKYQAKVLQSISYWKILSAVLFMSTLAAFQARSESESLAGSWSGGGTVIYASGERERARCNAHFSGGGSSYSVSATCATPSGSVSQDARIRRTGPNSYSGSFYNSQYNTNGSIHIVVHGNSQSVSLRGGNTSANLTLRR